MNTIHQHALAAALAFAAILALVVFAVHGQANTPGSECTSAKACEAGTGTARTDYPTAPSAARSAARAHLTMPYFSYARALPRNTEL